MKKFLLAGCAAAALAAVCGSASAADSTPGKFDIKIGGDAYFTAGYVHQNRDSALTLNDQNVDFANRARLVITPTATANNGMEYGANLRIRAWNSTGTVDADQAYIFAGGTWGRVEAGLNAGPNNQYGITAPSGFGTGGVMGDWAEGNGWLQNQNTFLEAVFGGGFNNVTNTNWATRLNYFTPRLFAQEDANTGLLAMVSFAPQNINVGTAVSRTGRATVTGGNGDSVCGYTTAAAPLQGCGWKNVVEAGLRYDGSFRGVTISSSVGYEHGDAPTPAPGAGIAYFNDLDAFQVGFQVGYAGFLVGGSYLNAGKSGYTKAAVAPGAGGPVRQRTAQTTYTGGISYETGPVVVGFNYAHGEDAGQLSLPGSRTADLYSVGATYTLSPGFTTSIEYLRSSTSNQTGLTSDYVGGNGLAGSGNANLFLWKNMITF
ncbi:MAG: porin [Rhodospirillaceae bacterium]